MASTLSDTVRFDPRRVRIQVLPIEDQRTYGAAFRRLAEARTPRAAHVLDDLGPCVFIFVQRRNPRAGQLDVCQVHRVSASKFC